MTTRSSEAIPKWLKFRKRVTSFWIERKQSRTHFFPRRTFIMIISATRLDNCDLMMENPQIG